MYFRGSVPNVPCGVERRAIFLHIGGIQTVPNVPCGVERSASNYQPYNKGPVPNVPCGVESPSGGRGVIIEIGS